MASWNNQRGVWVETVAPSWLVWQFPGSATALATVNLLRALPLIMFGMVAGVAADRMEKRRLLTICQTIAMFNLLALALLTTFDVVQLWMVYVTAFFTGSAMAFLQLIRTALIPSMVSRSELTKRVSGNCVSLAAVAMMRGPWERGRLARPCPFAGQQHPEHGCQYGIPDTL